MSESKLIFEDGKIMRVYADGTKKQVRLTTKLNSALAMTKRKGYKENDKRYK